jgi:hypothetical protein
MSFPAAIITVLLLAPLESCIHGGKPFISPNVCSRNDWGQVGINSAAYNTGIKPISACYMASSGLANNIFTKVVCGGTGSYGLGFCMALTSDLTTGADIMVGWGANFAGKLIFMYLTYRTIGCWAYSSCEFPHSFCYDSIWWK